MNWLNRWNRQMLTEMSIDKDDYMSRVSSIEFRIFCHVAYILLYNDTENLNHWKKELFGFTASLKRLTMEGGNKTKVTRVALIDETYGKDFEELNLENEDALENMCYAVVHSEKPPRPFDIDLTTGDNKNVFKSAVKDFYNFLVSWISKTDKTPTPDELYTAVDQILLPAKHRLA